jgi:hypothetical protein
MICPVVVDDDMSNAFPMMFPMGVEEGETGLSFGRTGRFRGEGAVCVVAGVQKLAAGGDALLQHASCSIPPVVTAWADKGIVTSHTTYDTPPLFSLFLLSSLQHLYAAIYLSHRSSFIVPPLR